MPRTINQGFLDFLTQLTPTATETQAARSHRASIKACLESNFGLNRFVPIGSFGNGTSISGYSDVDYLACLPADKLTQSSTYSLKKVRDALNTRFHSTNVSVDCPAVVAPFGKDKSETTEVVPAYFREENSYKVYGIADCANGWMNSSPDAHNAYVRSIDQKLNGKVKPLIRFIKAWKYYQNVPISSFYLELRIAKYASEKSSIVYDIDVKQILCWLRDNELSRMQDPMGISGYISPCKSDNDYNDVMSKLKTAVIRAEKARGATDKGNISDAFYWWNLLYNNKFPSYEN
jgi:Second Messenger Oligonucleotide or Dinucleotide Synthetase domain